MLALVQNIASLDNARDLLEEIVIVNNCSTADYSAVENFISLNQSLPFMYFKAPENLGVARGRNFGLDKGRAPIVIMLDDDSELQNRNCLSQIIAAFSLQAGDRDKAIISFKVLYYSTLEMQQNALPHKRYEEFKDRHSFETYFYAGGAHAIRRDVLRLTGNYPVDFFYGMEEYDLSYRIINAGFSIVYSDKIIMLHKESPQGRKPKREKIRMMWVNKSKVAYKYLPAIYFYSTALMWSLQYLKMSGADLPGFLKGWSQVKKIPASEQKQPLTPASLAYLKKVKARLWY